MAISREDAIKTMCSILVTHEMPINITFEELRDSCMVALSDMEKLQKIEELIDTHTMSRCFTEEDLHKDVYEKIVQIVKEA